MQKQLRNVGKKYYRGGSSGWLIRCLFFWILCLQYLFVSYFKIYRLLGYFLIIVFIFFSDLHFIVYLLFCIIFSEWGSPKGPEFQAHRHLLGDGVFPVRVTYATGTLNCPEPPPVSLPFSPTLTIRIYVSSLSWVAFGLSSPHLCEPQVWQPISRYSEAVLSWAPSSVTLIGPPHSS